MTRIIVHAGYHKTGTTSLQNFLSDNKALLSPHLTYYGKNDFRQAGAHARIYAQRPYPWRLHRFRKSLRRFLADVPGDTTIVLSRETFSGGMPGHHRLGGAMMTSYFGPALKLARVIISELRRRFGADVEMTFVYTTRAREPWIASVWGHLLRSIRLTDDFETFRARFPALASPEEEAGRMRGALAPIPVVTVALEDYADRREGPAAAILDLVGIPPEIATRLKPAARANPGQSADVRQELLRLNRQHMSKAALKAAKAKCIAGHDGGGSE